MVLARTVDDPLTGACLAELKSRRVLDSIHRAPEEFPDEGERGRIGNQRRCH